jgi:hypothetical protein
MQTDVTRAQVQPISRGTWWGLAALILLLGGLSLFLMGCDVFFPLREPPVCPSGVLDENGICQKRVANYYTCECSCTKGFSVGARIEAQGGAGGVNVRPSPAGNPILDVAPQGRQGTIIAGPVVAPLNGVEETWWQVDFDAPTQDGWVVQRLITVVSSDVAMTTAIDVCLPPHLNENRADFDHSPGATEIANDCSTDRVQPHFSEITGQQLPAGSTCTCAATTVPVAWSASCDADCTDPSGVCTVPGADAPPAPAAAVAALAAAAVSNTPQPLSRSLFTPTSICEVTGDAEIRIGDEFKTTKVNGVVLIHGAQCPPGQNCLVGLSYQLRFDPISFEVRFASDPKFVDLTLTGATDPEAVELTPFLVPTSPIYVGTIPAGASLNSARGRRSGTSDSMVITGRNGVGIGVSVDWEGKRCLLDGNFLGGTGGVVTEDGTFDMQARLTVGGPTDVLSRLVNQPPRANAGPDQTLECTSPDGAAITLDASATNDADNNIAFFTWRRGSEDGPHVGAPSASPTVTTQQATGETTYHLRVVDGKFATGKSTVKVQVQDTGAPEISCNVPVAILKHEPPVAFKATAADTCGPAEPVVIESADCFKEAPEGRVKDNPSCKLTIQGDTLTIENTGGVDIVQWTTRSADGFGNVGRKTCEIRIDK